MPCSTLGGRLSYQIQHKTQGSLHACPTLRLDPVPCSFLKADSATAVQACRGRLSLGWQHPSARHGSLPQLSQL